MSKRFYSRCFMIAAAAAAMTAVLALPAYADDDLSAGKEPEDSYNKGFSYDASDMGALSGGSLEEGSISMPQMSGISMNDLASAAGTDKNDSAKTDTGENKAEDNSASATADLSKGQISVTDLAKSLGMDLGAEGFSTTLLDGQKVSMNTTLDMDALKKLEMQGADQYLSSAMGSAYSGIQSNIFNADVPDMSFEDLNTSFASLKADMMTKGGSVGNDLKMPILDDSIGTNAKEIFNNKWGNISESLEAKNYKIPSGFNADAMLKAGASNTDKVFSKFKSSSGYKTANSKLEVSKIFKAAAKGPKKYSLDSNKTTASRLNASKSTVSKNIASNKAALKNKYNGKAASVKSLYSGGKTSAEAAYDAKSDKYNEKYDKSLSKLWPNK